MRIVLLTLLCSCSAIVASLSGAKASSESVWDGTKCGGSWNDPSNWLHNSIPNENSSVVIPSFGNGCGITLPANKTIVNDLTMGTSGQQAGFWLSDGSLQVRSSVQWFGGDLKHVVMFVGSEEDTTGLHLRSQDEIQCFNSSLFIAGNATLNGKLNLNATFLVADFLINNGTLTLFHAKVKAVETFINTGSIFALKYSTIKCYDVVTSSSSVIHSDYIISPYFYPLLMVDALRSASLDGQLLLRGSFSSPTDTPANPIEWVNAISYSSLLSNNLTVQFLSYPYLGTLRYDINATSVNIAPFYNVTMTGQIVTDSDPRFFLSTQLQIYFLHTNKSTYFAWVDRQNLAAYTFDGKPVTTGLMTVMSNMFAYHTVSIFCEDYQDIASVEMDVVIQNPFFDCTGDMVGQVCKIRFQRNFTRPSPPPLPSLSPIPSTPSPSLSPIPSTPTTSPPPPDHSNHMAVVVSVSVVVPVVVLCVVVGMFVVYRRRNQYTPV